MNKELCIDIYTISLLNVNGNNYVSYKLKSDWKKYNIKTELLFLTFFSFQNHDNIIFVF